MTATPSNITNLPVTVTSRLPMPQSATARGISPAQWRVLAETTFPSAQTAAAIEMAFDYCRVRGLDIFKKPVHIVPMWSSTLRKQVETVWAGINEVQITAARTGSWAGMDSPKWGPLVKRTFKGRRKDQPVTVEVTYPEWCEVTVYRMVAGQPRAFSEPVYWLEAYSTSGGRDSELPTDMWVKRPRGQLHKVAKAAALRAAFPEEAEYTAEEMEGKTIDAATVVEHEDAPPSDRPRPTDTRPKAEKPPIRIKLHDGTTAEFPRTGAGLHEAYEFLSAGCLDGHPEVVGLNNSFLDWVVERYPGMADDIADLRAAAAMAMVPPDPDPDPEPEDLDEFGLPPLDRPDPEVLPTDPPD